MDDHFLDIATFLMTGMVPNELTTQKKQLVTRSVDYLLIAGQLFKLRADGILRRCVLEHKRHELLREAHEGVVGGHNTGKSTTHKVLHARLWWPSLFQDVEQYCKSCDVCQCIGKPSRCNEMPLYPLITLDPFGKWPIDFVGPINPPSWCIRARYVITATEYLTRWAEALLVKDCTAETIAMFIFENIVTLFGCPKILMSDQGSHFLNLTIHNLIEEFMIHHQ